MRSSVRLYIHDKCKLCILVISSHYPSPFPQVLVKHTKVSDLRMVHSEGLSVGIVGVDIITNFTKIMTIHKDEGLNLKYENKVF